MRDATTRNTRREFLAAAAGIFVGPAAGLGEARSPNARPNIGLAGVGGRGAQNVVAPITNENVAATCDVDERPLGGAAERFPGARRYRDFRKMIDDGKDPDAVVVSTPHHTHAHAAARAIRAGKHVCREKPPTHTAPEARVVAGLAARHEVVTQHGTNAHTFGCFRRAAGLARGGAIGPAGGARVWIGEGHGGSGRPGGRPPVPASLDWDLRPGPSPERPCHKAYHPHGWHSYWDFGEGTAGNRGPRPQDLPFRALKLRHPPSAEAQGPPSTPGRRRSG